MTRQHLTSSQSINDSDTFQTASISPTANSLVVVFVISRRVFGGSPPSTPAVDGNGITWKQVQSVSPDGDRLLTCFRGFQAAPSSGVITFSFNGEIQDFCAWSVIEFDGIDTAGDGDAAVVRSTPASNNDDVSTALTVSLAPSSDPARNITVGGLVLTQNSDGDHPVNSGPGCTEIAEIPVSQFLGQGATLQTQDASPAIPAMQWTWSKPGPSAAIVLEVKAAPVPNAPPGTNPPPAVAVPVDEVLARFAPVLLFDGGESYFPVNAKRYLEHAALWAAKPAFDDKNTWGGIGGDPFPRQPLVKAGELRGLAGEDGSFLGEPRLQLDSGSDERFLELGGWKDRNESPEPDVTATSTNAYADRKEIVDRYRQGDLSNSIDWYHAEVIDAPTLFTIAKLSPALALDTVLAQFTNPVLICYYFFFPAHEQSVGAGTCTNIEAKEVSCHAGDWQCYALLADSDGSGSVGSFRPRFFGYTGSRPAMGTSGPTPAYRPHAFDGESRTALKVEAWRAPSGPTAGQPEVDGEHARFYVARGAHSLYTKPGTHDVDPYVEGLEPESCGRADGITVIPSDLGPGVVVSLAFLAKVLVGSAFGPFGLIAGVIAGAAELKHYQDGVAESGKSDAPNPDQAPSAGSGTALRPPGVAAAGVPADKQRDWQVGRDVQLDGRSYDFVVDRTKQVWWPSYDLASGFRGRWGQRVTSDLLARRSGPRFPDYPTMFLTALADGSARSLLNLTM